MFGLRESESNKQIITAVEEIAKARGVSMAVVSTAWCLSKQNVNPIVGLNSKERIDEAVSAVTFKLTEEEISKLEASYVPREVIGH